MGATNNNRRRLSLGEEISNAISHGLGAVFGIVALILMLIKADLPREYIGVSVFGAAIIIMYTMSSLYHSFRSGSTVKKVFRIFDYVSIYILIGGTYTPILITLITDYNHPWGYIFLGIYWLIITVGIVLKATMFHRVKWLHMFFYVLIGWGGIVFAKTMYDYNLNFLLFTIAGGLSYTIGIIFFGLKFKYTHFIWHIFVLMGTILHFIGIYFYLL